MFENLDKKKKIIICVVFVAALGILALAMSLILSPESRGTDDKVILTPNVDENQLEEKSKLEIYNQDEKDLNKYFSKSATEAERSEDKKLREDLLGNSNSSNEENDYAERQERYMKALSDISSREKSYSSGYGSSFDYGSNNSLSKIFDIQDKIRSGLTAGAAARNIDAEYPDSASASGAGDRKKHIAQNDMGEKKNFFRGTASAGNKRILQLVSSETIEQKRIVDRNIIPIRIKEDIRLSDIPGGLVIPKNTIVYGRISLGEDRINVDIESYRKDNVLYLLNFKVYDYDGREGIQMNNHSWIKIPSAVSKDVFEYSYERGTNSAGSLTGSVNTGIDLKEAKNLAVLSAGKEISKEVFERKRVFLPKKYQLWINIRSSDPVALSN